MKGSKILVLGVAYKKDVDICANRRRENMQFGRPSAAASRL